MRGEGKEGVVVGFNILVFVLTHGQESLIHYIPFHKASWHP